MNHRVVSSGLVFVGLLVCVFIAPSQSAAADQATGLDPTRRISQYSHSAWKIQDGYLPGLPEAITQTTDGYLWVGTFGGLVRFDGARFVGWSELHPEPLPDDRIFSVLGARDGSLWIGTQKGLAHWKDGKLTRYQEPKGRINSIIEETDGSVWIARSDVTDNLGPLCKVEGDSLQCRGERDGIPFPSANRMARDQSGTIWIGGQKGLVRWKPGSSTTYFQDELGRSAGLLGVWAVAADKDAGVWACVEAERGAIKLHKLSGEGWKTYSLPNTGLADPGESALFVDREHSVWVGTGRRGIYRIHGNQVDQFTSGDGLTSNAIAGFFEDREGTLWVASSKGIDSFHELPVATFSIREGLSADSVSSVLGARDGTLWIGNSGSLDYIRRGKMGAILTGHGLPGRDVTTIFEDHSGRLWAGIDNALWVYDQGKFRSIAPGVVFSITEDASNNIWARTKNGLIRVEGFRVREQITSPPALVKTFTIAADPKDGIWLGETGGELLRYRNGKLEQYPPNAGEGFHQIAALLVQADGSVLGATAHGVLRWKAGTRTTLTTDNGLPCNEIYTLVEDKAGSLWLYAKCGLVAITSKELEAWYRQPQSQVSYELFDGFDGVQPGITPLQPQATMSTDGRLWFVNDSVLQMIDPGRVSRNPIPPPVHIQKIVADGKTYLAGSNLRLPPRTGDLEIDYAAPTFVVPQKVRYRYKLEGHDRDWQEAGPRRLALYNDLPPGNYTFRVTACNSDGLCNEAGVSTVFTIVPAFYQTAWFLVLCIAASLALIWAAYRWRVRQVARVLDLQFEERLAERTRIAQDLHDTLLQGMLSASMQLHVANDFVAPDSQAKPLVGRVLELMKQVIDDGRNAVRGLRSRDADADLAQAFARVPEELGISDGIDFRVIVEGPPRVLHPMLRDEAYRIGREALSNAFRHAGASSIEVELEYTAHQLRLLVRDNGCGIDPQMLRSGRDGHFGLSGMYERAGRIGAKLKIWSRVSGGTEVELAIPDHHTSRSRGAAQRPPGTPGNRGRDAHGRRADSSRD